MVKLLRQIGWKELYPETLKRLNYFKSCFRKNFNFEDISDEELDKAIVYSFGLYEQNMVFNIFSTFQKMEDQENSIKEFIEAIKIYVFKFDTINFKNPTNNEEFYKKIPPQNLIGLFIEYLFAKFIKGKNNGLF
jgi:hypothetical protein